jgi:hypothetical protein
VYFCVLGMKSAKKDGGKLMRGENIGKGDRQVKMCDGQGK